MAQNSGTTRLFLALSWTATVWPGVRTSQGDVRADIYVMCLGNESPSLARQLGIKLPIYPVKGYSLTIPVGNHRHPPTIGSVDEHNLVAISRLGDRMRVTATAEFAGYDTRHTARDFDVMSSVAKELYPDGADYDRAQRWAGLRPMTPEGTPIIGPLALSQPLSQHRPRPYGLDDGAWLGAHHGRPDRRQDARHPARRHDGPLKRSRSGRARGLASPPKLGCLRAQ